MKEHKLSRSKRPTRTNRIIRLNNPVPSDHKNYRQNAECSETSQQTRKQPRHDGKPELSTGITGKWTVQEITDNRTTYIDQTRATSNRMIDLCTENRHKE